MEILGTKITNPANANINQTDKVKTNAKKDPTSFGGMTDFLNMFVAQLKTQDPLNPQQGTEFLSQTAQITQVEQLTNMAASSAASAKQMTQMSNGYAASMLGAKVTANVPGAKDGETVKISGIVIGVSYKAGAEPLLTLTNNQTASLSQLESVSI